MTPRRFVSKAQWLTARTELLAREREFTRLRDDLAAQRRALPWTPVERDYVFDSLEGECSLKALFAGRSQLIIYHFMLGPGWDAGCPSCSFWADNYNPLAVHLAQRDVTLAAVSRASIAEIERYRSRMGWSFTWVSSQANRFNFDFNVSFSTEEALTGSGQYNYRESNSHGEEAPGISVFALDENGRVHHTYSCYARGLDEFNSAYHYLDIVPKGRDEQDLPWPMAWVRRHDEYDEYDEYDQSDTDNP
jgi:predicted dithiol-disulfide oxidoreductase (DUF899 family)